MTAFGGARADPSRGACFALLSTARACEALTLRGVWGMGALDGARVAE